MHPTHILSRYLKQWLYTDTTCIKYNSIREDISTIIQIYKIIRISKMTIV